MKKNIKIRERNIKKQLVVTIVAMIMIMITIPWVLNYFYNYHSFVENKFFQAYGLYLTIVCSLIGLPTIIVFYYKIDRKINVLEENQNVLEEGIIKEIEILEKKYLELKNNNAENQILKNQILELKNKLKTVHEEEEISRWHS